MIKNIVLVLLIVNVMIVNSAKILGVFPTPSISHQVVFRKIMLELVKRGHVVTTITTDPVFAKNTVPVNLTEIDVHDVSYGVLRQLSENFTIDENRDRNSDAKTTSRFVSLVFETQLNSPVMQEFLRKKNHFDLVLCEAIVRPALIFSHVFNAPLILVSSLGASIGNNDAIGSPTHPVLYPSVFYKQAYNLTIWEKLQNLYTYYLLRSQEYMDKVEESKMLQKFFGPDIPTLNELYNNVHMLFLNVHPIWADNQPVPPSVVYMGGIHQADPKELPKDLTKYLDSSRNGVIYLSFGTNVLPSMIPKHIIKAISNVLSKLRYDVLWKWNDDELPVKSDNIKLSKWFPQADLLKHPNVKLFITQGGLQSTDEAITAGVPLVAIPMFADQWFNADKYVYHGIGKKLILEDIDEENFKNALETVLEDKSYRQNIVNLRQLMHDQQVSPLDRAMWWIEHTLRHRGAKHLRAPGANITWSRYFEIELLLLAFTVIVTSLLLALFALLFILRLLRKVLGMENKTNKLKKN